MYKYIFFLLAISFQSLFSEVNPKEAYRLLLEGNSRFMKDKLLHPDRTEERRLSVVEGQQPFAAILGCSDSRVSPEIIFDQGIGDLFIVRVAGNVAGPIEIDSTEYSVIHLKSSLIVVLGHENCGAVKAVLSDNTADIEAVASLIRQGLDSKKHETTEAAIKNNVLNVVATLRKSPPLKTRIENGTLDIKGAYYHLGTGQVEFLN